MKYRYFKFFLLLWICTFSYRLSAQKSLWQKVLLNNKKGKKYEFDRSSKENGLNKLEITYLGYVITMSSKKYKIVIQSRVWGKNHHSTGVIFIFDYQNVYVGKYVLGSSSDLPNKIDNDCLIFDNINKSNCDKSVITRISFNKDIPKNVFIECEKGSSGEKLGDIYSFQKCK